VSRRETIEVFGASLLDMMTCGFGAVLLLFIVQRSIVSDEARSLKRQLATSEAIMDAIAPGAPSAESPIEQSRASSSGPAGLGVPVHAVPLVVLVDQSRSMVSHGFGNLNAAESLVRRLLADEFGPTRVAIVGFGDTTRVIVPWRAADSDRTAWSEQVAAAVRHDFQPTLRSDLEQGLLAAIDLLDGIGSKGRLLIITDGVQLDPDGSIPGHERIVAAVGERASELGFLSDGFRVDGVVFVPWTKRNRTPLDDRDWQQLIAALSRRREAGGGDLGTWSIDDLLAIDRFDWGISPPALEFYRFEPKPALGQQLLEVTRAFGGRFIGIPIDPFEVLD